MSEDQSEGAGSETAITEINTGRRLPPSCLLHVCCSKNEGQPTREPVQDPVDGVLVLDLLGETARLLGAVGLAAQEVAARVGAQAEGVVAAHDAVAHQDLREGNVRSQSMLD